MKLRSIVVFHRAPIVMRTACLVIVTLLFSTAMRGYPQDSIDQQITVTGGDETALPVPPPAPVAKPTIPDLDLRMPDFPPQSPIQPPSGRRMASEGSAAE